MAETERIILDHILGLKVGRDTCFNEIVSLQSLRLGLLQHAVQVWKIEKPIRDEEIVADIAKRPKNLIEFLNFLIF